MNSEAKRSIQAQGNESKIRMVAFFVFVLVVIYQLTGSIFVSLFLVFDFLMRSFDANRYSALGFLSGLIVKALRLPFKPVYMPPKRFAARVGLMFSLAILILHIFSINTLYVSIVIAFFAMLESVFSICAGCYAYDYLQRFKRY